MARTNGYIYRDYRKGKSGGKKRRFSVSLLLFIVDVIMTAVMLLSAAATVICTITPNIEPESLGIVSTVVLGAPIIYIVLFCTLFYWVLRWKWGLVVTTLVFVIVGAFSIGGYYQIYFKQQATASYPTHIKLISYNICNNHSEDIVDSIASLRPNILCLQEYKSEGGEAWNNVGKRHKSKYSRKINSTVKEGVDFSCEIFTNQRIIRTGLIDSLPRYNAIWADILCNKDTLRVINLHLQSTTITAQDIEFVEGHQYVTDSARNSKIKSIADRLVENNIYRSAQARKVAQFIEQSRPMKMVVCGDFNDVPLSYTYKTIAKGLTDTYKAAGSGYRYTFDGFFKLLAIDHILVSDNVAILSYEVDYKNELSDHYPVITRLKLDKLEK